MSHQEEPASTASGLLEIFATLARYRRFISRFVLAATLGAGILALLLPKWYKSTSSVLPAERADLFGAIEGVSSLVKSFAPSRALWRVLGCFTRAPRGGSRGVLGVSPRVCRGARPSCRALASPLARTCRGRHRLSSERSGSPRLES